MDEETSVDYVADPTETDESGPPIEPLDSTERERTQPQQMYLYSTWVHVGPAAEKCEAVNEGEGTSECQNPLHFHAWCRLPNAFQHREIREKAVAAKARKARALRNPDSDAYAVLEDELDGIRRLGDDAKSALVNELTQKDWHIDYLEAVRDVNELEQDDGTKPYEHLVRDRQRWDELLDLPHADRPQPEFDELVKHLAAYEKAVSERTLEIQKPRREGYVGRELEELIGLIRDMRIDAEAMDDFTHVYSTWQWYLGTHAQKPRTSVDTTQLRFESLEQMQGSAPEVIGALQHAFQDLERTFQQGKVPGN